MGKHIQKGWLTSSDDIPQPVGIVMGRNLRRKSDAGAKTLTPSSRLKGKPMAQRQSGKK